MTSNSGEAIITYKSISSAFSLTVKGHYKHQLAWLKDRVQLYGLTWLLRLVFPLSLLSFVPVSFFHTYSTHSILITVKIVIETSNLPFPKTISTSY